MGLRDYIRKRSFTDTPEPGAKPGKTGNRLRFVVQKHAASHLHYDFRLEMEGVLKSWAVPKGPSSDPAVKRLAMQVEDHPYAYRTFEGTIPEGNYGAGTVIVWDEGFYEPYEAAGSDKKTGEKSLLSGLKAGKIKIVLHGKKLKGAFALVKSPARGENAWLLMKLKDEHASADDVLAEETSVKSGLTLEEMAGSASKEWKNGKSVAKKKTAKVVVTEEPDIPAEAKKAAYPGFFKPMLATLTDRAFDSPDWLYEIKWDGYRCLAYADGNKTELFSRNKQVFTEKFSEITQALAQLKLKAVLDGEVVALDGKGRADFQQLQNFARKGKETSLTYYVFDLLWYAGRDLRNLPLWERKAVLHSILPAKSSVICYSDHVAETGKSFFKLALDAGLEGIIAKRKDSLYKTGVRTENWLKIKNTRRLEAVICGFTKPRNSRKHFGAVILGRYEKGRLVYIGHSGSGFDTRGLEDLYRRFKPLIRDKSPFSKVPKTNMPVTWLEPELVCEVKFSEWTEEGVMRQPIFLGLREDKTARDEKNEKRVKAPKMTSAPKTAADTSGKEEQRKIGRRVLTFTNLDKLYFPKEKISKRDVLDYYDAVAPYIMPYLKDRPQSLNRHPNGIDNPNFYQKDVAGKVADWIPTYLYDSDSGEDIRYLVCTEKAVLLYMANLGCIEMNPWHSRIQAPEAPDWCVIDLDPDGNPFDRVIETALTVKQVLDGVGAACYCKTSGATGMHIYIPLGGKYSYDDSRAFAELTVLAVNRELPGFTSVVRTPAKRKGKIYLDFLQNRKIQTIAAPYSLRPKPGATVSMPLHWDELKKGLLPKNFTIHNALDRIKETGDLFKPVLGKGIRLETVLENMRRIYG